jgi:hypothetical protein
MNSFSEVNFFCSNDQWMEQYIQQQEYVFSKNVAGLMVAKLVKPRSLADTNFPPNVNILLFLFLFDT